MGEIIQEEKQKGGKRRPKKHSTHIDMTPMVDLMCLLITFFMLTTAFSKSKVMEIILPEKIDDPNIERPVIQDSRTINVILGPENKIFWYPGRIKDSNNPPALKETDYSAEGIRVLLLERNKLLSKKVISFKEKMVKENPTMSRDSLLANIKRFKKADDSGPIVLIKAYKESRYANIVDIIDEMDICSVVRYAIVDINHVEEKMVQTALAGTTTTPK
jgi:biopolymer transport protein ExbD